MAQRALSAIHREVAAMVKAERRVILAKIEQDDYLMRLRNTRNTLCGLRNSGSEREIGSLLSVAEVKGILYDELERRTAMIGENVDITFEFACRDDCLDQLVPSDLRRLVAERDKLRAALAPFTHDDLCEVTGGMVQGLDSPVYGKNKAALYLADFERARDALRSQGI